MRCPNCGGEVAPDEVFCGHCGARLKPVEPPPAPPTKPGGLPVVPIVIGVIILLVIGCLCVLGAGIGGICALPAIMPTTPTTYAVLTPRPTEVVQGATPTTGLGFTVVPKPPTEVVVTATPVEPPTPTSPAPPPPGDVPLRILSYVQRTNALSGAAVEIMGEVENTSSKELNTGWYLVYVTLKDKDGNVIPTTKDLTTRLQRPIMQPGQKSCFRYFFNADTYDFDIAQVDKLEPVVREDPEGHDAYTVELAVSNVNRSGRTITGDVTNNTQFSTRSVFILITLYDSEEKVIGVHYGTRVGEEQMSPGGTMGFTYNILSSEDPIVKAFDVLVIAYKAQ